MSFMNSMRAPFAAALLALATIAAVPTTAQAQASAPDTAAPASTWAKGTPS